MAIVLGSNTTPSRQSHAFFPAAASNNKMQGFGAFETGFSLDTSATTCIFDSFFDLEGGSVLNNGQLTLTKKLVCKAPFYLGPGTVIGNESPCIFSAEGVATSFPAQDSTTTLGLLDSEAFGSVAYSLDWSFDGQYLAVAGGSANNLKIYSFNGTSLTLVDSVSMGAGLGVSVRWHPTEHRFAVGKTGGNQLELYSFDTGTNQATLTDGATAGLVLAVAWSPDGNAVAAGAYLSTTLSVFPVTAGSLGTPVTHTFASARVVQINALDWDATSTYLVVGFNKLAGNSDLMVFEFNGSTLTLNASYTTNVHVLGVAWRPNTTQIAAGINAGLNRLELFDHNAGAGTLTSLTIVSEGVAVQEVDWNSAGTKLAMVKGVSASSHECQVFCFDATNTKFHHIAGTNLGAIGSDVRCSPNGNYVATIDYGGNVSVFGFVEGTLTFQDTQVIFDGDIDVVGNLAFQNNCTVSGQGTVFDVSAGKTLTIASGAKLRMEGITIKGLQAGTFVFTDTTAELHLANVDVELAANVNTTTGKVFVDGPTTVTVKGNTWTFDTNALLTVNGVTLWKDPAGAGSPGNIAFGSPQSNFLTLLNDGAIQEVTHKAAIDNLQTQITSNDTDIATNVTNIASNDTDITNLQTADTNLQNQITSNDTDIATNVAAIATNAAAITILGGGTNMTPVVGSVNFTDAHIPAAGSATLFQFDKVYGAQGAKPKLIFDPAVFDGTGPNCPGGGVITLPASRRLVFFGEGIVEFKDGVTLTFQGTTADSNPATTDWPELLVQETAEVKLATGATVMLNGKGIITVMEDSGILLDNACHLIFGSGSTDKLDMRFLGGALLRVNDPGALVSFCDSEFDLLFVSSYFNILRGAVEINRNNGVYKPGLIKNLILRDGACFTLDGTAPNNGVFHASPNQGDALICFDNSTSFLAGNGTLRFTSVSGAQTLDLVFDRRMLRKEVTALELVCELSMPPVDPTANPNEVVTSSTAGGGLVVPSQTTPGLLLPLQAGDTNIVYDTGGDGVWGYDSLGRLFHVKEDGTREVFA